MKNQQKGLGFTAVVISSALLFTVSSQVTFADDAVTAPTAQKTSVAAQPAQSSDNTEAQTSTDDTLTSAQVAAMDEADVADDAVSNKDPLERINRPIFTFNDKLDTYLIKPIAELYNAIMPKPLNKGVHNFFNNLGELPTIANDLLQFNFFQMTNDVWRLVINSTLGFGGFVDMATRMNLPYFQNDFGLTLSYWGYENSDYFVMPFLGPSTVRDGIIGMPVDYFEFTVYPHIQPKSTRYGVLGLFTIDSRANLLQFEPVLEEAAIDKYVFMRNAYMQHRAFQRDQVKHLGYNDKKSGS